MTIRMEEVPPPAWMLQVLEGVVLAALVFAPVAIAACFLSAA